MFEASVNASSRAGSDHRGAIIAIGTEVALVGIGGKSEAQIDVAELKDETATSRCRSRIAFRQRRLDQGRNHPVAQRRPQCRPSEMENAFDSGLAVEGKVENAIKEATRSRIARERAFCPLADRHRPHRRPAVHLGRTYTFRIIEQDSGKSIVARGANSSGRNGGRALARTESIVPGAVLPGAGGIGPRLRRVHWIWAAASRAFFTCPT